jgi:hypothetical protein
MSELNVEKVVEAVGFGRELRRPILVSISMLTSTQWMLQLDLMILDRVPECCRHLQTTLAQMAIEIL